MNKHLLEDQAKLLKLPGSDVFLRSHLYYKDDRHKDWACVSLMREAYLAFMDTHFIVHRRSRKQESQKLNEWFKSDGMGKGIPIPMPATPHTDAYLQYLNYENLKIAAGFELYLKARLISQDYIIHEIEKNEPYSVLAQLQKKQPIKKDEIFRISTFRFNGQLNYLPGLSKNSLKFSTIVSKEMYRNSYALSSEIIGLIEDFKNLRNQIHLPGDIQETPHISKIGDLQQVIVDFLNEELIKISNTLIQKHDFNWRPLINI